MKNYQVLVFTVRTVLFFILLNYISILDGTSQKWEGHLNLIGINKLIKGDEDAGSFLIKRKIGEKSYARLGISGYLASTKQTGQLGNNILSNRFNIELRPGLEKRSQLNGKMFFLYGTELLYGYGAFKLSPPKDDQYSLKGGTHDIGASPFIGFHYVLSKNIAILAETHLDGYWSFIHADFKNDQNNPFPNRTETPTNFLLRFRPFQYLTVCLTF